MNTPVMTVNPTAKIESITTSKVDPSYETTEITVLQRLPMILNFFLLRTFSIISFHMTGLLPANVQKS